MLMPLQVANPIYDAVFKHLLEDLEVTREMLSLFIGTQRNMEAEDELVNYVKQLEETEEALAQAKMREQEAHLHEEEERRQKEEERRQKLAAIAEMEQMREMLRKAGLAPGNSDKV